MNEPSATPPARPHWLRVVLVGRRPRNTLIRIFILAAASFVTFKFALLPVRVTGISMEPTCHDHAVNFINRLAYRGKTFFMKNAFRLVLLAAALALGWWLWTIFFPSPEAAIRKKLSALAATVSFDAQASSFSRAAKAMSFQGYFNSNVVIVVDVPELGTHTFNDRFELVEQSNVAFAALPGLKVSFLDATVRLKPDQSNADVSCTVRVEVGKDRDSGVQELRLQFQKISGDWLITRVETVKTLK